MRRAALAELLGTALLLAAVVGSGIMGERLAGGNAAIALLANSIATGGVLVALILAFGPVSGAHLNPLVTIAAAAEGALSWRRVPAYVAAQLIGAIAGVLVAHAMFGEPVFQLGTRDRSGLPQALGELVATFGLLTVVAWSARGGSATSAAAVAGYIAAAYWFTSSTSFANPAVTIARSLTTTFAGIQPGDAPVFILAQAVGAGAAILLFRWMSRPEGDLRTGTPQTTERTPPSRS